MRLPTAESIDTPHDERFLLTARSGVSALISTRGATLVALTIPDRNGEFADVVLGYDTVAEYVANTGFFFGATIGRVANRIAGAAFVLDGAEIRVTPNDGANCLHGGAGESFDVVAWSATRTSSAGADVLRLRHTSRDGADGFPGEVDVTTSYTLLDAALRIEWEATVDRRTPLNMTNHTYWNLAGAGHRTILDHELRLVAPRYTPVDEELIPTGEMASVEGTPFDFSTAHPIGERIGDLGTEPHSGYDHNFVFDPDRAVAAPVARLRDPGSGRVLEMYTDQPCVQFYSGNFMTPTNGKGGELYGWRSALCLEPQAPPDAVHQPTFGSIIVDPGEVYRRSVTFAFSVD